MEIKIYQRGGNKNDHPQLIRAAYFFIDNLLDAEIADNLKLKIYIQNIDQFHAGYMSKVTTYKNKRVYNTFEITINRDMKFINRVGTLAHELVHVAQMVTGRYIAKRWNKLGDPTIVEWEGFTLLNVDKEPYEKHPWEIEAHKLDRQLTLKWINTFENH